MPVYSFNDFLCAISGPNGSFNLGGPGSANTEGGVTIVMTEDKNTMTVGADGSIMHSLHAGRSATLTVRLLKVAPINYNLSQMYDADTAASNQHGRNTVSIRDVSRGDTVVCEEVAFAKMADLTWAKDGGENTWTFHCGHVTFNLGAGINVAA